MKTTLCLAVLLLATWVSAQQTPTSPAPPAGSPAASPSGAPSATPAENPPDSPAPPPSQSAGQDQGTTAERPPQNPPRALSPVETKSQIMNKIQSEPGLSSRNIRVKVNADSVVLMGSVPTENQRLLAERIAQSYAGQRRVDNRLVVETGSPQAASPGGWSHEEIPPGTQSQTPGMPPSRVPAPGTPPVPPDQNPQPPQ